MMDAVERLFRCLQYKMAVLYLIGVLMLGFAQGLPDSEIVPAADLRSSSRIVSGWEADEGQFPYYANLRMVSATGGVGTCGSSILADEWLLTAAHCLVRRVTFVISLGTTNLTQPEYILESQEWHIHEAYDPAITYVQTHDVGVLKLPIKVPFGPNIQPIRIQNSQRKYIEYPGEVLTLTGYGRTGDWWLDGIIPEIQYWVYQRGVTQQECFSWYRYSQVIDVVTTCAQFYNETIQGACTGDSGGPLTKVDIDGQLTQVGIMSFGPARGCNTENPNGYVRPEWYHSWIEGKTGINFDWDPNDLKSSKLDFEDPQKPIVVN